MKKVFLKALKKATVLSMGAILAFSSVGCNSNESSSSNEETATGLLNNTQTYVWTVSNTDKILRDVDYSAQYANNLLEMRAFRNENVGGQIIVTPKADTEYSIQTADLKNADGVILSKDCFTVYHQKYVAVESIRDVLIPTSTGDYPDALLPYENAVEYDETEIDGHRNQGIYINFKVPSLVNGEEQPAGKYTGTFKVQADGQSYDVPVQVELYDYTLSDVTHSQSCFMLCYYDLDYGEGDSSREMQEKYYNMLLDHRISAAHFPGYYSSFSWHLLDPQEVYLDYCQQAEKYTKDPRCANYGLITEGAQATYVSPTTGELVTSSCVSESRMKALLTYMAEYSVEHKVNLFKKAYTYCAFFDEYDSFAGRTDMANYNLALLTRICAETAEACQTLECSDQAFLDELLYDLEHITHLLVGNLTKELVSVGTMCTLIDRFQTQEALDMYHEYADATTGETWTYAANNPCYPYPNYHTEEPTMGSRILGWMMYEYDLVGNLYWDSVHNRISTNGQLQDHYNGSAMRWGTNGDGYLMYAGRQYGVEGPVSSIRLKAILDGNEEYDLLYALEEFYKERGLTEDDFDSVYRLVSKDLYTGVKLNMAENINDIMARSRDNLAKLLVMAEKGGALIESCKIANGKANIKISANPTATVSINGQSLQGTASGTRMVYTYQMDMNQEKNVLNVSIVDAGKTYAVTLPLGNKQIAITAEELQENASFKNEESGSIELVEKVINGNNVKGLEIKYASVNAEGRTPYAYFAMEDYNISDSTAKMMLRIYYDKDEEVYLTVGVKGKRKKVYTDIVYKKLSKGWNDIEIDGTLLNCKVNGNLDDMYFMFTTQNGTTKVDIFLENIILEGAS